MEEEKIHPEEKVSARRAHLTTLLTYVWAFIPAISLPVAAAGNIITQAISWFSNRKTSEYASEQAKEAMFMQSILALLYFAIPTIWPDKGALQVVGYLFTGIFHFVTLITAVIKTSYGKDFSYPFSPFANLRSRRKRLLKEMELLAKSGDNTSVEIFRDVLKNGQEKSIQIKNIGSNIQDFEIRAKVMRIVEILTKILENIEKDPKDARVSRQILSYYLDTTVKILHKYGELQRNASTPENISETTTKVKSVLDSIIVAFEGHLKKLMDNDLIELDTEIAVMEKTLKTEGL